MRPEVGAEMKLFGGNIAGKVTAVTKPTLLTTTWRAPTWPEGEQNRNVEHMVFSLALT